MLLVRALLLWSIISLHVVGGAALFRRLFPRESPWFGFLVPGLALVLTLNFIEHQVALPSLLWLLPFTSLGCLWALTHRQMEWKGFRLPAAIFLGSFAFTLTVRCLRPDILAARDGTMDLSFLSCFCMGEKLPPSFIWYPPLHFSQYYVLGPYTMSVVTRLLGLDVGTGFNLSSALLAAFDCFVAAAAAWRISRQKLWVTILAPVLLVCAGHGAVAYLWLTTPNFNPDQVVCFFKAMDDSANHNPLWNYLHKPVWYNWRELTVPGTWTWVGGFHSTTGGQFFVLFMVWSLTEVLRRRPSNWPWICLATIPLLTLVTLTWALPLEALFLIGAFFWVWTSKLFPRDFGFVLLGIGFVAVLLSPAILEFLTTTAMPASAWTDSDCRTQFVEFLVLWWPVFLPWLTLLFVWPQLSPAVKTVMIVLPIALGGMEFFTVGLRVDFTSKLWGAIYGAGWISLFPEVCRRRSLIFRGLTGLILISSLLSLVAWTQFTWRVANRDTILQLDGSGQLRQDPAMGQILRVLSRTKGETVITGRPGWMFTDTPILAAFTGNRVYVDWSYFCDVLAGGNTFGQAALRDKEVNDLYDGKCGDPLQFLRSHDITALVIHPGDAITDEVVNRLKKQLAPYYEYDDFRGDDHINAGIFVFPPKAPGWRPGVQLPPPDGAPAPTTNAPPA